MAPVQPLSIQLAEILPPLLPSDPGEGIRRIELIRLMRLQLNGSFSDDRLGRALRELATLSNSALVRTKSGRYIKRPPLVFEEEAGAILRASSIFVSGVYAELKEHLARNPHLLRELPPRKFEELVASIFENHGFDVELTPETRDNGYDIIAVQNHALLGSTTALIECKRYAERRKVSVEVPRGLLGVVNSVNAAKGLIVTTSSFTGPADNFIKENSFRLGSHGFDSIVSWLRDKA